jgi:predicted MPP superfamily phosphohydrolase
MVVRWVIVISILLLIEVYAFQAIKTAVKVKWVAIGYEIISLLTIGFIIWGIMHFDRSVGQNKQSLFTLGLLLLVLVPKIVLAIFLFGEDLLRLPTAIFNYFSKPTQSKVIDYIPQRRRFVSQLAMGMAAIPFFSLIYGMVKGKYDYHVIKQRVYFDDLPDAFDGFTITQISDVHSGSFDNPEKINYAIDLVNEQHSDMILFTGDIVNTHATEMHPWIDTFNRMETPAFGKFAVLGNHDYGEYIDWNSLKEKEENFKGIKALYGQIGFKLLLNEHLFINKGKDKVALVGVENWGHNFKQAGDLGKASQGLEKEDFKILMSHDPSHWEYQVKNHPKHFQLTLSGHTHGLQFGIEIPGVIRWSPAQYFYKQWAGLYENLGRYVYVNRGFGFHAYPGRVGIRPEITVIELKKRSNVA